jgi:hypothetical protein
MAVVGVIDLGQLPNYVFYKISAMLISKVQTPITAQSLQHSCLDAVSPDRLRATVESLAYARHFIENKKANRQARDWICDDLRALGYEIQLQGDYDNIIASLPRRSSEPVILLGAHYDTVPTTPGADDNGSAIALCLEAARVLAQQDGPPIQIAVFNREEDGLLGSSEFVQHLRRPVAEAHIFEMVGYFDSRPGSQSKPAGLPIPLPTTGDFIGLISNDTSNHIASELSKTVKRMGSSTPLVTLKAFLGIERLFQDLLRSDHTPFWQAKIPALMWTDTSNFRNPHYHLPTDVPDSLNYDSLADVTRMVIGHILNKSEHTS